MTELEAIIERHSVRQYDGRALLPDDEELLKDAAARASAASNLGFHVVCDERKAFGSGIFHYGRFKGVANYLAVTGPKGHAADELCGYYGEGLVLLAQTIGVKSCWVAMSYARRHVPVALSAGERLMMTIALGYADQGGHPHSSKAFDEVATVETAEVPGWFHRGVDAALAAPTAINQQKFHLTLTKGVDGRGRSLVELTTGRGPYAFVDLGIVRCHFELAAGESNFAWA